MVWSDPVTKRIQGHALPVFFILLVLIVIIIVLVGVIVHLSMDKSTMLSKWKRSTKSKFDALVSHVPRALTNAGVAARSGDAGSNFIMGRNEPPMISVTDSQLQQLLEQQQLALRGGVTQSDADGTNMTTTRPGVVGNGRSSFNEMKAKNSDNALVM
jgi:hypothetical protein